MSWIREKGLNWFQLMCVQVMKTGHIPRHIAFIMDGNRRYARKNKVHKEEGHAKGFDKLAETLQWCLDLGIPEVTVYAFSIENFKRTKDEVNALMELAREKFQRILDEKEKLMEHGVRLRVIGNVSLLPRDVQELIAKATLITRDNSKTFLNVAFAYTGSFIFIYVLFSICSSDLLPPFSLARDEMVNAIRSVSTGVRDGLITPNDVSEDLIDKSLYTSESSDPDLVIRTSGESRFSDFLLWQLSYSCVYFTDVLWPEFSIWHLLAAIFFYQRSYFDIQAIRKLHNCSGSENQRASSFVTWLNHTRENELLNLGGGS